MGRTIQSPGVEINEIDLSLRPNIATGTTVLATGFADKGPTDEVIQVTSLSEFEQIYGVPTTPAERYFYHTVKPIFNSQANILTYRLPYGNDTGEGFGNSFGALAYPVQAVALSAGGTSTLSGVAVNNYDPTSDSDPIVYVFGEPVHYELTEVQYNKILKRELWDWKNTTSTAANLSTFDALQNAGMIVLNKGQTTVNTKFEGFYLGVVDNSNINDVTDYDGILNTKTVTKSANRTTDYVVLPEARLGFSLSADNNALTNVFGQEDDSVSEVMENLSQFDISTPMFDDTLSIGLFKLRQSVFASDVIKLDYVLSESYVGSLDYHRQQQSQTGGAPQTFFIGTKEDSSPNISILVNDYLSHRHGDTYRGLDGKPLYKARLSRNLDNNSFKALSASYIPESLRSKTLHSSVSAALVDAESTNPANNLYTIGAYTTPNAKGTTKDLGSIPKKLDRLLDTVENPDIYDIDITVEGGLGTINAARIENGDNKYYDDTSFIQLSSYYTSDPTTITNTSYRSAWKTVYNKFNDFAEKRRKDHIFISDLPRPIFVQGSNYKTLQDPNKNFSLHIGGAIKAFTSILNSSYSTTYAAWTRVYDSVLDEQIWAPFSGTAAEIMANTDANFQPWFAPAGFTRGRVGSVNDIVLYPKQKQRDQLYKNSVNPVAFFPGDGFTVFGQKTLQSAPTAFDRINVRRLFLNLEKSTRATMKYFIFEPNTLLTRTRIINVLTPIFERAKNTEGLYDYLIVCDERNNTPDVIDQNELVVDIYLKPVRAAEFILVNFYATRTGTDFNEIVG